MGLMFMVISQVITKIATFYVNIPQFNIKIYYIILACFYWFCTSWSPFCAFWFYRMNCLKKNYNKIREITFPIHCFHSKKLYIVRSTQSYLFQTQKNKTILECNELTIETENVKYEQYV